MNNPIFSKMIFFAVILNLFHVSQAEGIINQKKICRILHFRDILKPPLHAVVLAFVDWSADKDFHLTRVCSSLFKKIIPEIGKYVASFRLRYFRLSASLYSKPYFLN